MIPDVLGDAGAEVERGGGFWRRGAWMGGYRGCWAREQRRNGRRTDVGVWTEGVGAALLGGVSGSSCVLVREDGLRGARERKEGIKERKGDVRCLRREMRSVLRGSWSNGAIDQGRWRSLEEVMLDFVNEEAALDQSASRSATCSFLFFSGGHCGGQHSIVGSIQTLRGSRYTRGFFSTCREGVECSPDSIQGGGV